MAETKTNQDAQKNIALEPNDQKVKALGIKVSSLEKNETKLKSQLSTKENKIKKMTAESVKDKAKVDTLTQEAESLKAANLNLEKQVAELTVKLEANSEDEKSKRDAESEFSARVVKIKKGMKAGESLIVTRSGTTFSNTPAGKNLAKFSKEDWRIVNKD